MLTDEKGIFHLTGADADRVRRDFEHPNPATVLKRQRFIKDALKSTASARRLRNGKTTFKIELRDGKKLPPKMA